VHTVVIVQARMGSERLPGKVLRDLAGRSMVMRVLDRCARSKGVNEVVLATSTLTQDDELVEHVQAHGSFPVVRGHPTDVLDRFAQASRAFPSEVIIRATADCPFFSPWICAQVQDFFARDGTLDYACTFLPRMLPRGVDVEVMTSDALHTADREATLSADREHVTAYLWRQPERFRVAGWVGTPDLQQHRWTVDTNADLDFARLVYGELAEDFDFPDVLAVVEAHPEWATLNRHIHQKQWGE
jgi:spore coat polysaccharide biosynthesis protein SpsF